MLEDHVGDENTIHHCSISIVSFLTPGLRYNLLRVVAGRQCQGTPWTLGSAQGGPSPGYPKRPLSWRPENFSGLHDTGAAAWARLEPPHEPDGAPRPHLVWPLQDPTPAPATLNVEHVAGLSPDCLTTLVLYLRAEAELKNSGNYFSDWFSWGAAGDCSFDGGSTGNWVCATGSLQLYAAILAVGRALSTPAENSTRRTQLPRRTKTG